MGKGVRRTFSLPLIPRQWGEEKESQTVLPSHIHKDALAPPSSSSKAAPAGGRGGGGWGGLSPLLWIPTPCPEPACSGEVPAQGTQAEDRTRNCRIFRASSEGGKHRKQRFCGDGFTHLKFPEQTRNSFNPLTPKATVYSFQPRNYDNRAS